MTSRVEELLRWQARGCSFASPLYEELLTYAADDVARGGPVASVLHPYEGAARDSALGLRFMGQVHRLVLEGGAPELAAHYPSVGGAPGRGLTDAFEATIVAHAERLSERTALPVQTNEPGRSAALLGAFLTVAQLTRLPLRLFEVGASAGLNLHWDRFRYECDGGAWGDPSSPVRFADFLADGTLPLHVPTQVIERAGCDPRPLDARRGEDQLTLLSYVWPDQIHRFASLRGAFEIASRDPIAVDQGRAAPWLGERFAPKDGACSVVFHSIVMQYLDDPERAGFADALAGAASAATSSAPVAHVSFEPRFDDAGTPQGFFIEATVWPGGDRLELGRAGAHGGQVRWEAPASCPAP